MNNIFKQNLRLRLLVVFLVISLILIILEGGFKEWEVFKHFVEELIIVAGAAIIVGIYMDFNLRKNISSEFNKVLEMKEEFGRAGILKYYSNYKDIDIRSFLIKKNKEIDIYVTYANTLFNDIEDLLEAYCKTPGVRLSIYIFAPDNPFIIGLGKLWGVAGENYNEDGIKNKIQLTTNLLNTLFERLKNANELKAKVLFARLKYYPNFYSFQRFDDELIYVPAKLIESKTLKPLAFLCRKTSNSDGIFNKCMDELRVIEGNTNGLEIIFNN